MTEQPSAEAVRIADALHLLSGNREDGARMIDTLCEQRVSVETERWQNRDRRRLQQIDRLQETVQSFQSARGELHDELEQIHEELIQARRERDGIRAALLARLQEPNMQEEVTDAFYHACRSYTPGTTPGWDHLAGAAIARIAEMLK